jgi:hypothetical protein
MSGIFSAFGLSASAGLNAYIPLLIIACTAKISTLSGWNILKLSQPWDTLESWWIIGLLIVLSTIEFFVDKVPAVNHANDVIQTLVRPAAGAIAFAASANVINDIHPVLSLAAGLLVAGTVHTAKAAAMRPVVSGISAGVGTPVVSALEDVLVTIVSILSILVPMIVGALLFVVLFWFVVWLYRRNKRAFQREAL